MTDAAVYTPRMRHFDRWFSEGDADQRRQRYADARRGRDTDNAEFRQKADEVLDQIDQKENHDFDDPAVMDHVAAHWLAGDDSWFNDPNARGVLSRAFSAVFRIGAETGLPLNTVVLPRDVDAVEVSIVRGHEALIVIIIVPGANIPTDPTDPGTGYAALTWVQRPALVWDIRQPAVLHFNADTAETPVPPEALVDTY